MNTLTLKSFAKINLTLDVMSKRPDGYHDIRSIMQTISLHDVITIEKTDRDKIEVVTDSPDVPEGERNLAHRAAVLIKEAGRLSQGIRITIKKRIPVQAGLGGGSSNGAYVLMGINRLFELDMNEPVLAALASELGSDVAFFMAGGTVLAEGRGEVITKLPDAPEMPLVLVKPQVGVPTPWAYAALDAVPEREPGESTGRMMAALSSGGTRELAAVMANDFEQVVLPKYCSIRRIKEKLIDSGALTALLAGSGAAVFGIFDDNDKALEAHQQMQHEGTVYLARTVSRSEAVNPWL